MSDMPIETTAPLITPVPAPAEPPPQTQATPPITAGPTPTTVVPKKKGGFALGNLFFHLSIKQKMMFARNIEMMTRSGMQLLDSLEVLKKQSTSKTFISMIDHLIVDLKNGHFLSVGLTRYRNVFGDFFINLVRVGETSGTLGENLKYLAEELEKKDNLQKKIRGAMVYPIIILIATLGITSILTFFIFPKILPVIKSLKVDLPITTVIFIAVSEFMLAYGVYVFLALLAGVIGFAFLLRLPRFRFEWHIFELRIPLVGEMVRHVNLINFSRTISLLLRGGVQIVEALTITSETLTNTVYQKELREIAQGVQKGDPVSKYLVMTPHLFPPTFSQMVTVGENTGKLEETLVFLADYYESELDESTKAMSNVLEPLLLLTMGLVVGFVALAIITPIYKITQTLGR